MKEMNFIKKVIVKDGLGGKDTFPMTVPTSEQNAMEAVSRSYGLDVFQLHREIIGSTLVLTAANNLEKSYYLMA